MPHVASTDAIKNHEGRRLTAADDVGSRKVLGRRVDERLAERLASPCGEEGCGAICDLLGLLLHGVDHSSVAMAKTGHGSTARSIEDAAAIFEEDVVTMAFGYD